MEKSTKMDTELNRIAKLLEEGKISQATYEQRMNRLLEMRIHPEDEELAECWELNKKGQ